MSGMNPSDWTDEERANVAVVRDFANGMGVMSVEERYRRFFAPDGVARAEADPNVEVKWGRVQYHEGVEAMIAAANKYVSASVLYKTEIHEVYASGPMVVAKRTDTRYDSLDPGKAYAAIGVFMLKNGKIVEWNDYYGDTNHAAR